MHKSRAAFNLYSAVFCRFKLHAKQNSLITPNNQLAILWECKHVRLIIDDHNMRRLEHRNYFIIVQRNGQCWSHFMSNSHRKWWLQKQHEWVQYSCWTLTLRNSLHCMAKDASCILFISSDLYTYCILENIFVVYALVQMLPSVLYCRSAADSTVMTAAILATTPYVLHLQWTSRLNDV